MAVSNGDCLFLENIDESIDPVLDNLLGRLTIKKGRYIKIGDKEAEYNPKLVQLLSLCSFYHSHLFHSKLTGTELSPSKLFTISFPCTL